MLCIKCPPNRINILKAISLGVTINLDDERQNSLATLGVILEVLLVVLVLSDGPNRHLVHTGSGEEQRRNAGGHHRERQPGQELVRVVRTGHEARSADKVLKHGYFSPTYLSIFNLLEQLRQWVAVGFRNFANCGTSWSQISQQHVNGEISQLTHLK